MKDLTKKGILAGRILETLSEDERSFIVEQMEETKPSRINNRIHKKKERKDRKHYRDDYDA